MSNREAIAPFVESVGADGLYEVICFQLEGPSSRPTAWSRPVRRSTRGGRMLPDEEQERQAQRAEADAAHSSGAAGGASRRRFS
jgi:hypothetical protein